MRCKRASHLMTAHLDGRLDQAGITKLKGHLTTCSACRAEWQRLRALDQLFRSAPMRSVPLHLHAQVMARINRREQARRAVFGSLALGLGATAVAVLTLAPLAWAMLNSVGLAPTLLIGGLETATQLLGLLDALSRTLFVLLDQLAVPLAVLGSGTLIMALALNGLWIATMRRLRVARR